MSDYPIKSPRKLIEVALPLDAINEEASLRKRKAPSGYPTALHKWWAQRPPAAGRAVIFSQLVNDPGFQSGRGFKYGVNKVEAAKKRHELFGIIRELVLWGSTCNEAVLDRARTEIRRSWQEVCELNKDHPRAEELFNPQCPPAYYDPFGGSGAMPLEAQRLGLEAYASDLNPVAVLINKAMIEIPPRFAGKPPVNPVAVSRGERSATWKRVTGLAEDVRFYGGWMQAEAERLIGHLYPRIEITSEMASERADLKPLVGQELTVVAWLWARTVKSPSPPFSHVDVPLATTFVLSSKAGKEVYVSPRISGDSYHFTVNIGRPPSEIKNGTKLSRGANFRCLLSDVAIEGSYIKAEGRAGRMGAKLMAVVADGPRGRVYISPAQGMEDLAASAIPDWKPELPLPGDLRAFWTPPYGITHYRHLFTSRQLVALTTFSDLLTAVREEIRKDASLVETTDDLISLEDGGIGPRAYAEAVTTYLAFAVDRLIDYGCALSTWRPKDNAMRSGLAKQAMPMSWDFAEGSPFGDSSSGFEKCVKVVADVVAMSLAPSVNVGGHAFQHNAANYLPNLTPFFVCTDPPYYDNIGYADLSDFYYEWLRRALRQNIPKLFDTIAVPKAEELVAVPYRHSGADAAEEFFLAGMTRAMTNLARSAHEAIPVTIFYAFKQSETGTTGTTSTGWETFLTAVIESGFTLTGTWPVRTEGDNRQVGVGNNALASSIVLVCRKRPSDSPSISRREFIRELNFVLPEALDEMTKGTGEDRSPVAPVDLSQAIIGPGMAVFSKYSAVLEADGRAMTVRTALQLINRFLAEDDFDHDSQFCLHWFEQHQWSGSSFGEADVLARAKGTSVDGVKNAGVLESGAGKVRLLKWSEYPTNWDPRADTRLPVWEILHHLIRAFKAGGEGIAGRLLAATQSKAEPTRQLAYRLYTLCERAGLAEDARAYNEIIAGWTAIEAEAMTVAEEKDLFGDTI